MAVRAITLDATWEEFVNIDAPEATALAARTAQTCLQSCSLEELRSNSQRLLGSEDDERTSTPGHGHGHGSNSDDSVELWRLYLGAFNGHEVWALWSVSTPAENDYWLYLLEFEPAGGSPGSRRTRPASLLAPTIAATKRLQQQQQQQQTAPAGGTGSAAAGPSGAV